MFFVILNKKWHLILCFLQHGHGDLEENFAWIGEEVRVPPGDCRPHFWQHQVGPGEKETIFNWWVIWIAVIWALWSHQNIISFRLETCCAGSIKDMIKFKSWEWRKIKEKSMSASLYSILEAWSIAWPELSKLSCIYSWRR